MIATNDTNDPYSYCLDAAKPIPDAAWTKLLSLYTELDLAPPCHQAAGRDAWMTT